MKSRRPVVHDGIFPDNLIERVPYLGPSLDALLFALLTVVTYPFSWRRL